MASTGQPEAVNAEDREIIEKLAKLQNMYTQIGGLRTLLPEKLINPARFALDNPGGYEPEKLAAYLQTAAQAGSRDVEQFKKDWHSDDVRELWQTVNTNDLPQGGDAWTLDYSGLLQNSASAEQTFLPGNDASHANQPQTDAEVAKTIDDFRARHPDLSMHVSETANLLPIDITVAQLDIRVQQSRSTGLVEYNLARKPFTKASPLRDNVIQSIQDTKPYASLVELLDVVAAYHDILTRPCDKCTKLFNGNPLQLPLIRQRMSMADDQPPQYQALHHGCG